MRYPMAKTRLAVARHEAAHVLVLEHFGGKVKAIHVSDKVGKSYMLAGDCRRVGPVGMWCTLMAGSCAEYLWHGTPKGLASARDFKEMMRTGMKGEDFRVIWEESQRLVRKKKASIWRLAKRLLNGKVHTRVYR